VRKPGVWPALVQGRWTLAERCESDGQRHYVAYENAPHTWSSRALTRLEARSVELLGEGYMGYEIARMLQRSEARISECLSSASAKLALRGTADLSQLAAELGASERQPLRVTVTPAERRVLELVRLGYSNQEIAQRLQRSERTIAHQVSALLAKFGSVSRRVLIVAAHRN